MSAATKGRDGIPEWWADHANLAELWRWLEDRCEEPRDNVARYLDEPWHWTPEWLEMHTEQRCEELEAA